MFNLMAIKINHRSKGAMEVQQVLTKFGCNIKLRLGLHESEPDSCSNEGLIILQLTGADEEIKALETELNVLEGVTVKPLEI